MALPAKAAPSWYVAAMASNERTQPVCRWFLNGTTVKALPPPPPRRQPPPSTVDTTTINQHHQGVTCPPQSPTTTLFTMDNANESSLCTIESSWRLSLLRQRERRGQTESTLSTSDSENDVVKRILPCHNDTTASNGAYADIADETLCVTSGAAEPESSVIVPKCDDSDNDAILLMSQRHHLGTTRHGVDASTQSVISGHRLYSHYCTCTDQCKPRPEYFSLAQSTQSSLSSANMDDWDEWMK